MDSNNKSQYIGSSKIIFKLCIYKENNCFNIYIEERDSSFKTLIFSSNERKKANDNFQTYINNITSTGCYQIISIYYTDDYNKNVLFKIIGLYKWIFSFNK